MMMMWCGHNIRGSEIIQNCSLLYNNYDGFFSVLRCFTDYLMMKLTIGLKAELCAGVQGKIK
jgi:hypothetical protein